MLRKAVPLYVYSFFMIMSVMVLFPLLPEIRGELNASYSEISVLVATLGLVRLLLAVPSGFIADRYGKKKILVGSAASAVLGLVLIGTAQGLVQMVLGRALIGASSILSTVSIVVILAGMAGPEHRGATLSMNNVAHNAGAIVAPVFAGLLARWVHWRLPLFVAAGLIVFGTTVMVLSFREDGLPTRRAAKDVARDGGGRPSRSRREVVLRLAPLFALSLFVFFFRGGFRHTLLPLYGTDVLHIGVDTLGFYLGFTGVIAMLSIFAFGFVADRFGRLWVLVPSLGMVSVAGVALFLPPAVNPFLVACLLLGLGSAINSMPNVLLADYVEPEVMGRVLGLNRVFADSGYFLGTLSVGALLDWFGFEIPVAMISAYALLTLVMVVVFMKGHGGEDRGVKSAA
ncbi:MAG TPA: MFS transporter [Deferrisomatales bacterium]|nr:MFS transporter [Deferrisomatales bacterium]